MGSSNLNEAKGTSSARALRIAMIGTRGIPSALGGIETAVEEIGRRLVDRGHAVTVYCRSGRAAPGADPPPGVHLGMRLVYLPALPAPATGTLSHSALSVVHATNGARPDTAFVFDPAHVPFVRVLRRRGIPTTVHVGGLEQNRDSPGGAGRYHRWAEHRSVGSADALIAGAQAIADHYRAEFSVPTEVIGHGTHLLHNISTGRLGELGLAPGGYHLVVADFAPENQVDLIIQGYLSSTAALPLAVIGAATSVSQARRIAALAASPRVRMLTGVRDQEQLDQLFAHAVSYLHGRSVGGTNLPLLRAMGARTAAIAWDGGFNRDVLGVYGAYFRDAGSLAALIEDAELNPHHTQEMSEALQKRAAALHNWGHVTDGYEDLAQRVVSSYSDQRHGPGRDGRTPKYGPKGSRPPSTAARGTP